MSTKVPPPANRAAPPLAAGAAAPLPAPTSGNRAARQEQVRVVQKKALDTTAARIAAMQNEGVLDLPSDYSAGNALAAAGLKLLKLEDKEGNLALEVCTPESINNALLDMVVQGLSPTKDQCYFIVYGTEVICQRSYHGAQALVERVWPGSRCSATPIYEADELEIEVVDGEDRVVEGSHKRTFAGIKSGTIIGAYAIIKRPNEDDYHEIMTIEMIKRSWSQGANYKPDNEDGVHQKYDDRMTRKTVLNRACMALVRTTTDAHLLRAVERQEVIRAVVETDMDALEAAQGEPVSIAAAADAEPQATDPEEAKQVELLPAPEEARPDMKFMALIDENGLAAARAQSALAELFQLDDVREITNKHYEQAVADPETFLAAYRSTGN